MSSYSQRPGDHIVASFIPSCGTCRYCATGRQSICDWGANALDGCLPTGRYPLTGPAGEYGAMDMLGTFSEYGVLHEYSCIKIEDYYPLDKAVLVSCGVPTGWGSAVNTADVRPGQTVVIIGIGGIGINAVQGAVMAGAKHVIAVDLLESKRDFAIKFGATHAFASVAEAMDTIAQVTWGQMADAAIITPGIMTKEVVTDGFDSVGKGGKVVMTALTRFDTTTIELPGTMLTVYRKEIRGSLFGDCNPTTDIPRLLNLYDSGDLKIDELVTQTYSLEQVNQGYADLIDGKNMRGIIAFDR
ncbi:zinc-binding dehydrogenase [Pimelobacter simplex]|uniref:zinc-binding dehydrogenase n=1 Tax=Nocardioides simplex TaxID=2045 RepID=UPI002150251B|nr:zinc-binding dehydrogenase [Pimelobacter simplex]